MKFIEATKVETRAKVMNLTKTEIEEFINFILDIFSEEESKQLLQPMTNLLKNKRYLTQIKKMSLVEMLVELFTNHGFVLTFYQHLSKTSLSAYLYGQLVWEKAILKKETIDPKFSDAFEKIELQSYMHESFPLKDECTLIFRQIIINYSGEKDYLFIEPSLRNILKLLLPIPKDYTLHPLTTSPQTDFSYSNEEDIFPAIQLLSEMIDNKLISFGKTNEKPMAKSLNLIKETNTILEFYSEKKQDAFVADILTRSLYYYRQRFQFKSKELDTLKTLINYQFSDALHFSISRLFASHLKKIRFGRYQNQQEELFKLLTYIIGAIAQKSWVSVENIFKHTYYKDLYFNFEQSYDTESYEFISDTVITRWNEEENKVLSVGDHHAELFHEPILKGAFFYLGALGLLELKYDKPISPYPHIKAKDKEYISVWDGLKYIKLTKLGEYIFNLSSSYSPKEMVVKKDTSIKFDEFKPIITVAKSNTLMIAKIEPFVEKLDNERYILSHAKLFRECKSVKMLKEKIEKFYKNIEQKPPQVFVDFFEECISNANPMKRNLKQIVIELKENKKLLNLLMSHKKLQELFVKAEGYRILVFKDDIPKLSKILKENGFFLEF